MAGSLEAGDERADMIKVRDPGAPPRRACRQPARRPRDRPPPLPQDHAGAPAHRPGAPV